MLDVRVWTEEKGQGTTIRHSFYEKPLTSPLVFHNRGACPTKQKIIILAEETKRRLFNQDRAHQVDERLKDITVLIQKMANSGYGRDMRKEILVAGIKRYYRLVLQELAGGRSLYRPLDEMAPQRRMKALKTRLWFKPTRGGTKVSQMKDHPVITKGKRGNLGRNGRWRVQHPQQQHEPLPNTGTITKVKVIESPVFVPYTRDSKLKKALQTMDDTLGECMGSPSVRFVERCGGQTIGDLLGSSNPWAKALKCGRKDCLPCQGRDMLAVEDSERPLPGPGQPIAPRPSREETIALPQCTREGVGYVIECWPCRLQGLKFRYVGETSRSAYQRARDHAREIQSGKKTHPLVEHFMEHHQGVTQEVLFRTLASFQTALQRQIWESVEIDSTTNSIGFQACLNHKTEWGSSKDPALVPRRSPLSKGLARAQAEGQMLGNTTKRTRAEMPNPRPTKMRRGETTDTR